MAKIASIKAMRVARVALQVAEMPTATRPAITPAITPIVMQMALIMLAIKMAAAKTVLKMVPKVAPQNLQKTAKSNVFWKV